MKALFPSKQPPPVNSVYLSLLYTLPAAAKATGRNFLFYETKYLTARLFFLEKNVRLPFLKTGGPPRPFPFLPLSLFSDSVPHLFGRPQRGKGEVGRGNFPCRKKGRREGLRTGGHNPLQFWRTFASAPGLCDAEREGPEARTFSLFFGKRIKMEAVKSGAEDPGFCITSSTKTWTGDREEIKEEGGGE